MTLGDLAQFVGVFTATIATASCLGCLVDRSLMAWRTNRGIDEDY
ncbi:hypothetical protein [Aureimonas sp. SA4125]|nr:hypothetical protein [Aureimonas sp. SA4125]